jgi:hypothetical protein
MATKPIAQAVMWAVIYAVLTLIPFSQFIGGAGFITLSVVIAPVIAYFLKPHYAFVAGLIGGLLINAFMIGYGQILPGYSILIVLIPITLGSIAMHYKKLRWLPALWLIFQAYDYLLAYQFQATPIWLTHYIIGILISLTATALPKLHSIWLVFPITMVENSMLNIGSIHILNLPAFLWTVIFPVSFTERIIAAIGAAAVITALEKRFPQVKMQ